MLVEPPPPLWFRSGVLKFCKSNLPKAFLLRFSIATLPEKSSWEATLVI
jgi:hypothetical protein